MGGRGSSNPGGGGNVNQTIQQRADDWEIMGRVDMGTNINPVVRERNDMIANVRNGFSDGEKRVSYSFERNGQLIRYLNGYQSNTGDYDGMHISQTLDLHSVTMTKRSFANFLTYLDRGRFNGYADFARSELENQKKNNRRGRKR